MAQGIQPPVGGLPFGLRSYQPVAFRNLSWVAARMLDEHTELHSGTMTTSERAGLHSRAGTVSM